MRALTGLIVLLPSLSVAHNSHQHAWLPGNWLTYLLAFTLLLYLLGLHRAVARPGTARIVLFLAGWTVLTVSLLGPIDRWAHVSLAGHMLQHMVLLAVAPPLVLLARPMPQFMLALPTAVRRRIGPYLGRLYGATAATPVTAFLTHGLVIWLWHLPLPFQIVLHHQLLHDGVHILFFGTGLWFWWSLIAPGRLGQGGFGSAAVLSVLTMMHMGMLGALLTFAPQLLYPEHPAGFGGFDQLSDQQLSGLVMWIPGGLIYTVAALVLTAVWLKCSNFNDSMPASR